MKSCNFCRPARARLGVLLVQVCIGNVGTSLLASPALAQQAIVPSCAYPDTFEISKDGKTCVPKPFMLKALDADPKEACKSLHGSYAETPDGKPGTCSLDAASPTCPAGAGISYSAEKQQCVKEQASVPVSDPGNYVRDCLKPIGQISGAPTKHVSAPDPEAKPAEVSDRFRLYVLSQSADGNSLKVVPATARPNPIPGCYPDDGATGSDIKVSDVIASGALRSGFVYGALVAPFKFYLHSGEIAGSATVGPYLGWRREGVTNSMTIIGTAGISNVPGKVANPDGSTKTVPLTAMSVATGAIFEVTKGKSPFRIGLLFGKDWVDAKSSVKFENNARTWAALQFGFDLGDK